MTSLELGQSDPSDPTSGNAPGDLQELLPVAFFTWDP